MSSKKILILFIVSFLSISVSAQSTITGYFQALTGQKVRLFGFDGFISSTLDSTVVSDNGIFKLKYSEKNKGMGYLVTRDNKAYFVVLSGEDIQLKGETFDFPETITILSGKENQLFKQYATEHLTREQALDAWIYLQKIYQKDSIFIKQKISQQNIASEIMRIKQEDNDFLKSINEKSYMSWYLPIRKLISSVSAIAQYRTEEIEATIAAFRKINYTDERLYKSGLLKDVIESHYWLLENMGQPLDSVYNAMNISTNYLLSSLSKDEKKFNEITKYVFDLLESHSLFKASEYLAVKVLTQNSCTLNNNLANKLEMYRAMKTGNTAPDILFTGDVFKNGTVENTTKYLSEMKSDYKVVIFGASWCSKCTEELGQLLPIYDKWKAKGVEVVFISLDTVKSTFKSFSSVFPFISMCDYKKWNTQAVKDYYVFATPTLYLLNSKREILLRPNSVSHLNSWIDWYLVQGNK